MKKLQNITVLAFLLGASGLVNAQTPESSPAPMENVTDIDRDSDIDAFDDDNGDDSGKWGLAGLLGLLGLLGLRRHRDGLQRDHNQGRGTNAH